MAGGVLPSFSSNAGEPPPLTADAAVRSLFFPSCHLSPSPGGAADGGASRDTGWPLTATGAPAPGANRMREPPAQEHGAARVLRYGVRSGAAGSGRGRPGIGTAATRSEVTHSARRRAGSGAASERSRDRRSRRSYAAPAQRGGGEARSGSGSRAGCRPLRCCCSLQLLRCSCCVWSTPRLGGSDRGVK
uniref:Uncharacterized protein n=1 Tax=Setaria viridis TaxID=4556 RepID=A0A4U6W565_SETVI|nr:hypothetical protein SEVIR_1G012350v2 [Setaria viridis]